MNDHLIDFTGDLSETTACSSIISVDTKCSSVNDSDVDVSLRLSKKMDKHNVNASAAFILEAQANWLKATPGFTVILEGHCDDRGTRDYNLALGDRRANAIKEFLISLGVDGSRIQTISYGKERPAAEGNTSEAWAENRRVVTIIGE